MADRDASLKGEDAEYFNQSGEDTEDVGSSEESESESDSELFEETDSDIDEEYIKNILGPYFDKSSAQTFTRRFGTPEEKGIISQFDTFKKSIEERITQLKPPANWTTNITMKNIHLADVSIEGVNPKDSKALKQAISQLINIENKKISDAEAKMNKDISDLTIKKAADKKQQKIDIKTTNEQKKVDTKIAKEQKKLLKQQQQPPSSSSKKPSLFRFSRKQKTNPVKVDSNVPPPTDRPRQAYWDEKEKKLLYRSSSSYMNNASQPILTFPYATTFHDSRSQQYYVPSSSYNNLQQIMTTTDEEDGVSF